MVIITKTKLDERQTTLALNALIAIANQVTVEEGDVEKTERELGLPYDEIVEMAHDNMIEIARATLAEIEKK